MEAPAMRESIQEAEEQRDQSDSHSLVSSTEDAVLAAQEGATIIMLDNFTFRKSRSLL